MGHRRLLGAALAAVPFVYAACVDARPQGPLTAGAGGAGGMSPAGGSGAGGMAAGGAGAAGMAGAGGMADAGVADAGGGGTNGTEGGVETGGTAGTGAGGAGGTTPEGPIRVLIWNNATIFGAASRVTAIPLFKAREATDNILFDTTYAHTALPVVEGPVDTGFDASVFTDEGLDRYDVVLFLNPTGNTFDDAMKDVRRAALRTFIEKKGRGFVGTHTASWAYTYASWPWYSDFIGASFNSFSPANTSGVAQFARNATHPILTAARTPNPWTRLESWITFTRDPLSSPIPGITVLLTGHDQAATTERPCVWVHEMPMDPAGTSQGRMFYAAFGFHLSAFAEPDVMNLMIAGIKWAAHRL